MLIALFIGGLSSANAVVLEDNSQCHAEACQAVAEAEEAFGDAATAETVYEIVYADCAES